MNFKTVGFFLSHTYKHKFRFQLRDTFFHCFSPFSGFSFQSNPHSEDLFSDSWKYKVSQSILYTCCYFSQEPQDNIYTTVSLSRLFFFCNIGTAKICYSKKHIFHTQLPKQNFYLFS